MKNKKGFTLIELIVVMAVIGILVLLGVPKFMNYTKEAKFTKFIHDTKELETASERYYMDKQDWPRLTDEPYSAEDIEAFAQKIYDATGKEVALDPEGHYYDIDYDKLQKYIKVFDSKEYYIIQNPVGNVYALEGLTEKAKTRLNTPDNDKTNNKPVAVILMSPEEFITTTTNIEWSYEDSYDPDGDKIVDVEWKGKQDIYSTVGEYTVQLRVKDARDLWSDWTEVAFNVEEPEVINRTPMDFEQVAYFSGTVSDYIIRNPLDTPTKGITAELWIKTTDSGDGILSYAVPGSDNEFLIYSSNSLRIDVNDKIVETGVKVNDGQWHHIAVTWDSLTGSLKLYKDGVLAFKGTVSKGSPMQAGGSLILGQEQDTVGGGLLSLQSFKGFMDEVRMWNRPLTQEEIVANMNSTLTGYIPSLRMYYNFNQTPVNNIVPDMTPNDNYGIIHGNVKIGSPDTAILGNFYASLNGSTSTYMIKNPIKNMPSTAFTAEVKIKTKGTDDGIVSYATTRNANELLLFLRGNTLEVQLLGKTVSTNIRVNDNVWHDIAVTWDSATGQLIYYLDGVVKLNTTVAKGSTIANNGSIILGQDQDTVGGGFTSGQSFVGGMDNVRLWNRVLTQEEIIGNINGEISQEGTGLVFCYDFDDEVLGTTTIMDKSDNGNTLTMKGSVTITK